MRLIEPTKKAVQKDSYQKIIAQINTILPFGKSEEHAEDAIIAHFMRGLDNRFVMLRNLPMEGTKEKFPPILIGPTGFVMLNLSAAGGDYRAKEESWWEMNKTTHRFGPGRPNLIKQTQEYAQRLAGLLDKHQKTHPPIIPVLIFVNPGVHLETSNPAIRLVRMDGVESLIGSLLSSEEILDRNEINYLSDVLEVMANPEKTIPVGEGEDFFGRDLLEPKQKPTFKLPNIKLPTKLSLPAIEEKFNFTSRQWFIIELLMVLTIIALLAGIIYVLLAY